MLTVTELKDLIDEFKNVSDQISSIEAGVRDLKSTKGFLMCQIIDHLDSSGIKGAEGTDYKVSRYKSKKFSFPKEQEARKEFEGFVRKSLGDDVWENTITINHMTLNKMSKEFYELAESRGEENYSIPGLGEPFEVDKLRVTKKK